MVAAYTYMSQLLFNPETPHGRDRLLTLTAAIDASSVGGRRIVLLVVGSWDNKAISCWPQVTFLEARTERT